MELPCGHGKPDMSPIHVKCLISSFSHADLDDPQPPRCPMCRTVIDQATLADLVDYVREGTVASFPNAEDQEQKERIYKEFKNGLDLRYRLAVAQGWAEESENIQPTEDEKRPKYWTDEIDSINQHAQALLKDIREGFLTLEELEQKQTELHELERQLITFSGRADVLFCRHNVFNDDDSYFNIVNSIRSLSGVIENTEYSLKDEQVTRQRYEDEGKKVVKTIWSGFDTVPPTKPSACAVCSGEKGGEFIILDCGHGASTQSPLHVRCTLDGIEASTENEATAHCPICKDTISANTLARLAERVSDNVLITYPSEDGRIKNTQLIHAPDEIPLFIEDLIRAENIRVGKDGKAHFQPWNEEQGDAYYDHMINEAKKFAKEINTNLAKKEGTLESLETDRFKLSRVKDRLQVAAGRTVMHEEGSLRDGSERSFRDIHQLLKTQLRHIDVVDFNVRREQEAIRRQDEGHTGRLQHVWNGFDSKPPTKPSACAVCFGEFGGEFMSLECKHGAYNNNPLHVRCLLNLTSEAAHEGADAHCPICSTPFSKEALSRLIDCIQHDRMVRFPDDRGRLETTRLFDDSYDQKREKEKVLSHLDELRASHAGAESHVPADKDALDARYDHLIQKAEGMAREITRGIKDHAYTLEEFEEKEETIGELKQRVAWLMERGNQPVFREKYQHLLEARERLEKVARQMQREREEMQRREIAGPSA